MLILITIKINKEIKTVNKAIKIIKRKAAIIIKVSYLELQKMAGHFVKFWIFREIIRIFWNQLLHIEWYKDKISYKEKIELLVKYILSLY